ncbi:biotin/lipoyl-containing protein [Rhizobium sp.]
MSFKLSLGGASHLVEIVSRRPHLVVRVDGREYTVEDEGSGEDGRDVVAIDGEVLALARSHNAKGQVIRFDGHTSDIALVDPRSESSEGGSGSGSIRAPMPGSVVSIDKRAGDAVKRGELVLTIESMKLQTALTAPRDGIIAAVLRAEGEKFEKDEVIVRLEQLEEGH